MTETELRLIERTAVLEAEVKFLKNTINGMDTKLDELLSLRSKGMGAFWLASGLLGTGIVGAFSTFIMWIRG